MFDFTELVEDYEALSHTYIPDQLVHRDDKIKELSRHLRHARKGVTPPNLLITGPTGSGKTVTINYVTKELKKATKSEFLIAYIVATGGAYRTLVSLAEEVGTRLPLRGLSFEEGWKKFKERIGDKTTICILDEIDKVLQRSGEKLLYYLSSSSNICTIGISNLATVLDIIDDERIHGRYAENRIVFHPYSPDELTDILLDRVKLGKVKIKERAVKLCAALTVSRGTERRKGGDARLALELLRKSIDVAERSNADEVLVKHIRIAEGEMENSRIKESVKALNPLEKKLLLYSVLTMEVESDKPQSPGEVYERTNELAPTLGLNTYTNRRLRDFLGSLEFEGFVTVKRRGRGRGKGSKWTVEVPNNLNKQSLISIIEDELGAT